MSNIMDCGVCMEECKENLTCGACNTTYCIDCSKQFYYLPLRLSVWDVRKNGMNVSFVITFQNNGSMENIKKEFKN
jgi:hypothetical protein